MITRRHIATTLTLPALVVLCLLGTGPRAASAANTAGAYPPALFDALAGERDVATCATFFHRDAKAYARQMDLARTVLKSGTIVYEAGGRDSCIDGNDNSRLFAFVRSNDATFRKVFDGGGVCTFAADGTLVSDWHDSAYVVTRTVYDYDGSVYRDVRHEIVWYQTGEAKPVAIPVHFAGGTSSATLTGKVYYEFPDTYHLDAAAGQTMSIEIHPSGGTLGNLSVGQGTNRYESHGQLLADRATLSWTGKLPATGGYFITIDGSPSNDGSPKPATYSMKVTIK